MWVIGLFQLLVPIVLIAVLAFVRQPNRWRWALNGTAFVMATTFLWATARWDLTSSYLRIVIPILFAVAAVVGYRRIAPPAKPVSRSQTAIAVVTAALLIVFMGGLNWFTFRGYRAPAGVVDLASPLRGARFIVLHGGASPFINGHFHVRPQTYALDMLGQNAIGARATAFADRADLSGYAIFGAEVFSPCDGTVAVTVDEYDDLTPPAVDAAHPAGNHVLIECQGVEVLLAHLKRGSVRVSAGDAVTVASRLAQVGNTGNTSEPHLHIHAERGGQPRMILDGAGVPISIDGRFLVRGSVFESDPRP